MQESRDQEHICCAILCRINMTKKSKWGRGEEEDPGLFPLLIVRFHVSQINSNTKWDASANTEHMQQYSPTVLLGLRLGK